MTKPPDPRRRFIDLAEAEATAAGCDTAPHFARHLAAKLDAAGLAIVAIPDHQQPVGGHVIPAEQHPEYVAAKAALHERTSQ